MKQRCCPMCFGDRGLQREIIPSRSDQIGRCDFCRTDDVPLVDPSALFGEFANLIEIYEQSEEGEDLVTLLKRDWKLFSHTNMGHANARHLLAEILDNGEIVRKSFALSPSFKSDGLAQWVALRDELMHENRYFLERPLDFRHFRPLLEFILADELPEVWYRARIMSDDRPFAIAEMGAPPKRLASHGRANPAGIPYLYLGSTAETAVAEVRPHTGERACVANFRISGDIKAVDLRDPRRLVSPFYLSDTSAVGQLLADIPLLERLGDELTRPVLPRSAAIDYIPTQYLCEMAKKAGFSGVIYRSSVSTGMNLALFNPIAARCESVAVYDVSRVTVAIERRTEA